VTQDSVDETLMDENIHHINQPLEAGKAPKFG
jgi:hypothetical protein